MSPVVNISEWIPKSPLWPAASSEATVDGMPPMPVCRVEPSVTKSST